MVIAIINAWSIGSTGHIMLDIARLAENKGYEVHTFSKSWKDLPDVDFHNHHFIDSYFDTRVHCKLATYTGLHGCFSILPTLKFLLILDRIKPDIIHLHNLHGWFVNLPLLFGYIKRKKIKVIWTLHDCWSFTGHCPHFVYENCMKWKTGCYDCPKYTEYPASKVDQSRLMWRLKKKWFTGVENMTLVTPSNWLAGLVKQSFLKDYPVKVINNGIDLNIFKPTRSTFRQDYGIAQDECMLLGVAFGWGERKGLDIFIELANRLPQHYRIVLVGTDEAVERLLPENIVSIHQTDNQAQLAEIYSASDLFVNPSREENYPTVNMEALACGTPVVTFNTGGSPEIIDDSCGAVVERNTVDELINIIADFQAGKLSFSASSCLRRALNFSYTAHYEDYLNLYHLFSRNKM